MLSKMIGQCKLNRVQIVQQCIRSSVSNTTTNYENIRFDSISTAYGYKSKYELFRGWLVFKLCSYKSLVNHLSQLLAISNTVLGQRLFGYIMRSTLYGHFAAGTDKDELKQIAERLHKHGVKLILDYCMEADLANNNQQKTNEEIYDKNVLRALKNTQTAAELYSPSEMTSIKITSLVSPDILQKLNQIIEEQESSNTLSIFELASKASIINKEELLEVEHFLERINRIIQEVKNHNGKIFIDAEQSYFQTAIHKLVLELQEHYNRDRFIVYNTYQCYRKTTLDTLRKDLIHAKKHGFNIGFKLVRGAYMDQERKRASTLYTIDPIHPNFAATTECYHRAFIETLEYAKNNNNKVHVFVASHNENTVQFALKTMKSMNIKHNDGLVSFGTLLGMCDYLAFPLASVGCDVYKWAPYGPIDRLLPYLTRRAQENRAIFAKAEKDRQLHFKALKERIKN
ncbi:unnamed protein product [Adineta steineri]|uniref:Proline dehydrogenase n=2 Tax=Adineta steineri TaxID=433720 RepID=A0A818SGR3_9BILA|nr:unnamed protein product [Adineta steineri]CAF3668814.1 unnamed protein product [Adineta steineri]